VPYITGSYGTNFGCWHDNSLNIGHFGWSPRFILVGVQDLSWTSFGWSPRFILDVALTKLID